MQHHARRKLGRHNASLLELGEMSSIVEAKSVGERGMMVIIIFVILGAMLLFLRIKKDALEFLERINKFDDISAIDFCLLAISPFSGVRQDQRQKRFDDAFVLLRRHGARAVDDHTAVSLGVSESVDQKSELKLRQLKQLLLGDDESVGGIFCSSEVFWRFVAEICELKLVGVGDRSVVCAFRIDENSVK